MPPTDDYFFQLVGTVTYWLTVGWLLIFVATFFARLIRGK